MENKKQPNLFFAGEVNIDHQLTVFRTSNNTIYLMKVILLQVLNVDGVTGGFNFQVSCINFLKNCLPLLWEQKGSVWTLETNLNGNINSSVRSVMH